MTINTLIPEGKQALKSLKTKNTIMQSVIELIHEGGFSAASSTRISRLAGVSWGVVQYHFGDKEGILRSVLENCNADFMAHMSASTDNSGTLHDRITAYINRCWQFYQSEQYLTMLEILIACRASGDRFASPAVINARNMELLAHWHQLFPEQPTEQDDTISALIRHIHLVLTGLVVDMLIEGNLANPDWQLECLIQTVSSRFGTL